MIWWKRKYNENDVLCIVNWVRYVRWSGVNVIVKFIFRIMYKNMFDWKIFKIRNICINMININYFCIVINRRKVSKVSKVV